MNLLALAQRLHRESARSGSGPTSITGATKDHARLFDWIADAWLELQSRPIDWRWMRKSLDGDTTLTQTSYTGAELGAADFGRWRVPSDEYTVKAYLAANPTRVWKLRWVPLESFKTTYIDAEPNAAQPIDWSIADDDSLLIGPLSDQVYKIRAEYLMAPTLLEDDADEPEFATQHHLMLMWRALMEVGKFDNAPDVLARAAANYARMEHTLLAEYARPITLGGPLA